MYYVAVAAVPFICRWTAEKLEKTLCMIFEPKIKKDFLNMFPCEKKLAPA
jgi:hypothetical protein